MTKAQYEERFRAATDENERLKSQVHKRYGYTFEHEATYERMLKAGHTQADVARMLGVSVSTMAKALR